MAKELNMMPIDGGKLHSELKKRGVRIKQASVECGYSTGYLNTSCKAGRVRKSAVTMLKNLYNINYDDIKPDIAEQIAAEPQKTETAGNGFDYQKLADIIYGAVYGATYQAVKKVWSE